MFKVLMTRIAEIYDLTREYIRNRAFSAMATKQRWKNIALILAIYRLMT